MRRIQFPIVDSEGHTSTMTIRTNSDSEPTAALRTAVTQLTKGTVRPVLIVDDVPFTAGVAVAGSDGEIGGIFSFRDGFGNTVPVTIPGISESLKVPNSDDLDVDDPNLIAFVAYMETWGRTLADSTIAFTGEAKERYTSRRSSG